MATRAPDIHHETDDSWRVLATNLRQLVDWMERDTDGTARGAKPASATTTPQTTAPSVSTPPLIDTHMVRRIIAFRDRRNRIFGQALFGEPVWDMLLDLFLAQLQHRRVSITSLAIASNVPTTTALRYIDMMVSANLVERLDDPHDGRRKMISLTHGAYRKLGELFEILAG